MDVCIVVLAELSLLLRSEAADRVLEVTSSILAANHEANLARWVGWDGGVGVLDVGEDFLAVLLELGD